MAKFFFIVLFYFCTHSLNAFNANSVPANKHTLFGHWIFSPQETLANMKALGLSPKEINQFSKRFKPASLTITANQYSSTIGNKTNHTESAIKAISNDGNCYLLQLKDPKIPLDIQQLEICIINDKLYLPSIKGAKEVFFRKGESKTQ